MTACPFYIKSAVSIQTLSTVASDHEIKNMFLFYLTSRQPACLFKVVVLLNLIFLYLK
jgi:hypothetical protein